MLIVTRRLNRKGTIKLELPQHAMDEAAVKAVARDPQIMANFCHGLLTIQSPHPLAFQKNTLNVGAGGPKNPNQIHSENELLNIDPRLLSDINSSKKEQNTQGQHGSIYIDIISPTFLKEREESVGLPKNKYTTTTKKWKRSLERTTGEDLLDDTESEHLSSELETTSFPSTDDSDSDLYF